MKWKRSNAADAAPGAPLAAARASSRVTWILAGILVVLAVGEAVALAVLASMRTAEPNTLLVDRSTGAVEALRPASETALAADPALAQSLLVQYVVARETFDVDTLQANYRRVALWSAGAARADYAASMEAANPDNPLARLGRDTVVQTTIRSVSRYPGNLALVRFETRRIGRGGAAEPPASWVAVLRYGFSRDDVPLEERVANPLGFKVWSYRRDPEAAAPPELTPRPSASAQVPQLVAVPGASAPTVTIAPSGNGSRAAVPGRSSAQDDEPTYGAPD